MCSCVKQERYLVDLAVAVVFADFAGTQPEEKKNTTTAAAADNEMTVRVCTHSIPQN